MKKLSKHEDAVRKLALAYPESHEDSPWGECAIKVRRKVFLFMSRGGEGLSLSVKLPDSRQEALLLPFTEPTGYGLGKSGWVSAKFEPGEAPPLSVVAAWLEESYRAVAPKTLVATLDGAPVRGARKATKKSARRKKA
jgi:predicted DNA-binding protein (MmcQ/YjbR family)